jgi:hypothetical protein
MIERKAGTADFSTLSGDGTATAGGLLTLADIFKKRVFSELAIDADSVYVASKLIGGWISRNGITADRADTTDTAVNIVTAIPNAVVGSWFVCTIFGEYAPTRKTTLTAGAGVTISGTTYYLYGQTTFTFLGICTNVTSGAEAVTIYWMHSSPAWGWNLTDGYIWIGGSNGQVSAVVPAGEVAISNTGATTVTSTHSGSAHHSSVTLTTAADTLLGLTGQALDLDTKAPNLLLAGPTTGAVAAPTFRSLVDADVPATLNPTIAGLAVSANSATPGDVRVAITNTNAAGDSRFSVVNSTGGTFAAQVTGSTYPSVPNVAALASDSSISALVFSTDGDIATGGDGYISFKTGGYNAAQERMRILADGNVKVNNLTASRVMVTDGSTYIASGTNTDAEIAAAVTASNNYFVISAILGTL